MYTSLHRTEHTCGVPGPEMLSFCSLLPALKTVDDARSSAVLEELMALYAGPPVLMEFLFCDDLPDFRDLGLTIPSEDAYLACLPNPPDICKSCFDEQQLRVLFVLTKFIITKSSPVHPTYNCKVSCF